MSIYVNMAGGLGNQLFQYGAALLIQNSSSKKVFLTPSSLNPHSRREYNRMIFRRIPHVDTVPEMFNYVIGAYADWDPEVFDNFTYDLQIIGCYQHLPSFLPVLPLVSQDLVAFLAPYRDEIRARYSLGNLSQIGFIHVRRGDYLAIQDGTLHYVQTPEYYAKALTKFSKKRWFVVSNDVDWCRSQQVFSECSIVDEPDEFYGLALMSLCHGGAIIGNSSYSWWGAMIGAESAGATVVYPSRWFRTEMPDLFPARWICV